MSLQKFIVFGSFLGRQELKTCGTRGSRLFHSSKATLYPGQDWRKKKGLAANPNAYGAITDLPDYTFIDGSRTPPGPGKVKRAIEQRDLTAKIIQLSSEVDFAVKRRERLDREEEDATERILKSKLKPKGKDVPNKPSTDKSQ